MRVFDCVIVSAQADLDLLDARFTELEDLDVVHVITECAVTLDGKPKPLYFAESDLWRKWHGKWNHIRVEAGELPAKQPRARKDMLREYLAQGVNGEPSDVVMHGGIDEIPSRDAVEGIMEGRASVPVGMEMRWCAYTPRLVHPDPWRGTVAQEWRLAGSFAGMREKRTELPAIVNAGTRLSMLDQDVPEDGKHPDGKMLREAEIDETWPKWVRMKFPC